MTRLTATTLAAALLLAPGCRHYGHGGPLVGSGDERKAGGTIGGVLQGSGGGDPLPGRRVEAVDLKTAARFSAVTNVTGGFSIQVPPGDYRLQIELREGERVTKDPGTVRIHSGDLDANIVLQVGAR